MMVLSVASGLLVASPLAVAAYHRFRRPPTNHLALLILYGVTFMSGLLASGVLDGRWGLIFVQLAIVGPGVYWGLTTPTASSPP